MILTYAKRIEAAGRWPDDVELWRVDCAPALAQGLDRDALRDLDETERERAQRFLREEDRVRFVLARATLRQLLAERLGTPAHALRFGASGHGRPELQGQAGAPAFNVSHSGPHALVALSCEREVGVDVELLTQGLEWRALGRVACTAAERDTLECVLPAQRARAFMRIWTAKEALLKAVGVGIAEHLQAFSIDPREEGGAASVSGLHAQPHGPSVACIETLRFHWLDELPGAQACLAWSPAGR
ncbi:4'-phosphopantetheinyl transferase family protein [Paraburkholderia sp. J67]|uniref:4'-phosphopantetheinyl transferase family protein n=1 Tax=Paraburkholderia sp. J67 TaxID=2805435 RepID=UPI002ABE31B5|nr:4'-phosphopantetheinyl transferase superfamily protein [Paraburkholderia sp. J67]